MAIQNMFVQTSSRTTWNISVPKLPCKISKTTQVGKEMKEKISISILNKENFHTKITNLQIKSR
jgi:hypothetical protein